VAAEVPLDCRLASQLLSASYERDLTAAETEALRRPLSQCLRCRRFEGQLRFLREASRRFGH
jgi:hypothetical protein